MKFINILLMSLIFMSSNMLYAQGWSTTKFEIIYVVPLQVGKKFNLLDELNNMTGNSLWSTVKTVTLPPSRYNITPSDINKLEMHLEKVALKYQNLGFKEPVLDDFKNGKYQIFMFDFDDELGPATYSGRVKGGLARAYIRIDVSRIMNTGGNITPKLYDDLAHELFHAIQASYPLFEDPQAVSIGNWIAEGTADFMGHEMSKDKSTELLPQIRWGARVYSEPLYVEDDTKTSNDYWTSSLWQYIGESIARAESSNQSLSTDTRKYIEPNYTYLINFFNQPLKGKASEDVELDWLEASLHSHPKIGKHLNQVYAEFITALVHYMPTRTSDGLKVKQWSTCLFRENINCKVITSKLKISPSQSCPLIGITTGQVSTHEFSLNKVASRCFELRVDNESNATDIFLRIKGNNEKNLESLWIGTGKGSSRVVEQAYPTVTAGVSGFLTEWVFPIMEKPQIFTIMNVAEKPSDTVKQSITLEIGFNSFNISVVAPTANGAN